MRWRYRYDGEHRLTEVLCEPKDRKKPQTQVSFRYDPLGRRISKTRRQPLNGQPQGKAVTTRFVWNGFLAYFPYDLHCLTHPLTAACFHQRGNATRPLRTGAASWR